LILQNEYTRYHNKPHTNILSIVTVETNHECMFAWLLLSEKSRKGRCMRDKPMPCKDQIRRKSYMRKI
jgi:hypothetical protein